MTKHTMTQAVASVESALPVSVMAAMVGSYAMFPGYLVPAPWWWCWCVYNTDRKRTREVDIPGFCRPTSSKQQQDKETDGESKLCV